MKGGFPQGFTKGIPEKPGCYVLITDSLDGTCDIIVADVIRLDEKHVNGLGDTYEPGLYVSPCPEDCSMYEIDDYDIVAYMELKGVSAFDIFYNAEEIGLTPKRGPRRTMTPAEARGILAECLKRNR